MKKHLFLVPLLALQLGGCGPKKPDERPPIQKQTAADEVLRIGETWVSVTPEKKLLDPPSKISRITNHLQSTISFTKTSAKEVLVLDEEVQIRAGSTIRCSTRFEHAVRIRWGRRQGAAAVEISRPALGGTRSCDGMHPEGALSLPAQSALFVLRSDELVAVEPPLDRRVYRAQSM